ncbi:MAG: hypothetical protein H0V06_01440 [Gemmatimonadetes bacterium]|nr:hypothetical protein [Gemmatimonadota bacterium]MBA3970361.1 hypothetical protein [Gemmatimonadota bacterium]MDQ3309721.1 hypothetical protein [Gemmatimonadota bacterium]MDQ3521573.1 hypothetical protein [Gemmatimonadota bacterium]
MSRKRVPVQSARPSDMDRARDDLFGHIHRCGVMRSTEEQQMEWMEDTIQYIGECYPALRAADLGQLKEIGLRFCRPAVARGAEREVAEANAA